MWITKAGNITFTKGRLKESNTQQAILLFLFTERFAKDKLRSVTLKILSLPLAISKLLVCPVLLEKNTPAKWCTLELGNHGIKKGHITSLIKLNRQAPLSAGLTAETFISDSLQHARMPLRAALPSGLSSVASYRYTIQSITSSMSYHGIYKMTLLEQYVIILHLQLSCLGSVWFLFI